MKIIDCFMYFDEDLVLEIRLNTLNKFVDKFILCEATKDHAGNKRELKFNIDHFPNFKDKIESLSIIIPGVSEFNLHSPSGAGDKLAKNQASISSILLLRC